MSDDKKDDDQIEGAENGQDVDPETVAAAAALITPRQLDPSQAMWHLVTPALMRDVIGILKELPYEKVHRVLPALSAAPLHQ